MFCEVVDLNVYALDSLPLTQWHQIGRILFGLHFNRPTEKTNVLYLPITIENAIEFGKSVLHCTSVIVSLCWCCFFFFL